MDNKLSLTWVTDLSLSTTIFLLPWISHDIWNFSYNYHWDSHTSPYIFVAMLAFSQTELGGPVLALEKNPNIGK